MRKRGFIALALFIFAAGIGVYSYPAVSGVLNKYAEASEIEKYQKGVREIDEGEADAMIAEAEAFNGRLSAELSVDPFQTGDAEPYEGDQEYNRLLDVGGVMGYIDIPQIDVYLPVYHGTSAETLKKGAGHLYGSALPVGGKGTHSVVSAHRGLPSAELFTDLDQIEKGDIFYFHVLNKILAYQVDQIETVEPTELSLLDPIPGGDYMTLFTCTPYGINSHRLLVRGIRIPYEVTTAGDAKEMTGVDAPKAKASVPLSEIMAAVGAALAVLILLTAGLFIGFGGRKKAGKNGREKERQE